MTVSMHLPCGETIPWPIRTWELMQSFGEGQYVKIETAPGSNEFIMGKIVGIQCESGFKDGSVPTAFNVMLHNADIGCFKTVFVRTVG